MTASVGDDILRWASENGNGRWVHLSEAIAHTMAIRNQKDVRSWILASDLSDLGHMDVDWDAGTWSASPPCLVVSRGLGLCAYLTGWRTSMLLSRFEAAADDLDIFPFEVPQGQGPKAIFAKCSSVEAIEGLAARLRVPVVYDPCKRLAELIRFNARPRRLGAPPPPDEELARFEPGGLRWISVSTASQTGLYRFELHGRKTFRLFDSGEWYIVDRSEGQLQVLAGRDDVVRWHAPSADGSSPRAMSVHFAVSLPPLVTRAAVSASGLLPLRRGGRLVYINVARDAAATLAENCGLVLSVTNDPISLED
jgi:hypothetical protein